VASSGQYLKKTIGGDSLSSSLPLFLMPYQKQVPHRLASLAGPGTET